MPAVEASETVDVDGKDRVEAQVTGVNLEELAVDWPTYSWLWNSMVVLANSELEQYILLDP